MDTKLHEAVRYCDIDGVLAALKEKFDPNSVGVLKWTPVQEAARAGERDILFHLLAHGGTVCVCVCACVLACVCVCVCVGVGVYV